MFLTIIIQNVYWAANHVMNIFRKRKWLFKTVIIFHYNCFYCIFMNKCISIFTTAPTETQNSTLLGLIIHFFFTRNDRSSLFYSPTMLSTWIWYHTTGWTPRPVTSLRPCFHWLFKLLEHHFWIIVLMFISYSCEGLYLFSWATAGWLKHLRSR